MKTPMEEFIEWMEVCTDFEFKTQFSKKCNEAKIKEIKALDDAYDKGFKDGNQRDLSGSLIEQL